nr:helicase associated domain-containing protein [Pseudarthrobacter chlorophenolicus]
MSLGVPIITDRSKDNQDLIDWAQAKGRPPRNPRNPDPVERSLCWRLDRLRSRYRNGISRIGDLETLLTIPGALLDSEQPAARERLEALRLTTAEQEQSLTFRAKQPVDPARWEASFKDLNAWFTGHQSLPRRRSENAEELRIANWLNIQRTHARKNTLSQDREDKLRTVPGALEPRARRLSDVDLAKGLASFHAEHGRLPRQKKEGEHAAAGYLTRLRGIIRAGEASEEALAVLEGIPGAATTTAPRQRHSVDQRLQQLREYIDENGHLPSSDVPALSRWLARAVRGTASTNPKEADRARTAAQALTEGYTPACKTHARTGSKFPGRKRRFIPSGYVAQLEEYVARHGHLPSAGRGAEPMFSRLRLRKLLANPSITESQTARINALLAAPSWGRGNTDRPAKIAAFYAAEGRLPRQGAPAPESALAHLLTRLRVEAREGRMPPSWLKILADVPGALIEPGRH